MKLIKVLIIGGCFDVLHPGHIDFLSQAKKMSDYLVVLLEPDEKVRMMKGADRPKTNLEFRIKNLEKTGLVDEVIVLPVLRTNEEYEKEIGKILIKIPDQLLKNIKVVRNDKSENIRVHPPEISVNPIFVFGITKNDRNIKKNQNITQLAKKMGIGVVEVNELLPEWSTSKLLSSLS